MTVRILGSQPTRAATEPRRRLRVIAIGLKALVLAFAVMVALVSQATAAPRLVVDGPHRLDLAGSLALDSDAGARHATSSPGLATRSDVLGNPSAWPQQPNPSNPSTERLQRGDGSAPADTPSCTDKESLGLAASCPAWVGAYDREFFVCAQLCPVHGDTVNEPVSTYTGLPTPPIASPDGKVVFTPIHKGINESNPGYLDPDNCYRGRLLRDMATIAAFDADTGAVVWSTSYEGTGDEPNSTITSLSISPDGRVLYAAANTEPCDRTGEHYDVHAAVLAFDATTGKLLWQRHPVATTSKAQGLTVSADGGLVVLTGFVFDKATTRWRMVTAAFDSANGDTRWSDIVDGPERGVAGLRLVPARGSVSMDDEAAFYVLGVAIRDDAYAGDLAVWSYGRTGRLLGSVLVPRPFRQAVPVAFAISPDGRQLLILTSQYNEAADAVEAMVIAVDTSSGRELWRSSYAGTPGPQTTPVDLAVDPNGQQLYVTAAVCCGPAAWAGNRYADTVAFRLSDGARAWKTRMPFSETAMGGDDPLGGGDDYPVMAVNPRKHEIHVAATEADITARGSTNTTVAVTYNTATGAILSQQRYQDPLFDRPDGAGNVSSSQPLPGGIAVSEDGSRFFLSVRRWNTYGVVLTGPLMELFTEVQAYDTPDVPAGP